MRRVLAAAAAAALLSSGSAQAIDPVCETLGEIYAELGCGKIDVPWIGYAPEFAHSVLALYCPQVHGTLPGTTTPTAEQGYATCSSQGATVSAVTLDGNGLLSTVNLTYTAVGGGTLAGSSGTFRIVSNVYRLRIFGTYSRAGSVWAFVGTQEYQFADGWPIAGGPFAATGHGLPNTPGFTLAVAAP